MAPALDLVDLGFIHGHFLGNLSRKQGKMNFYSVSKKTQVYTSILIKHYYFQG